jgi:FdhD protein
VTSTARTLADGSEDRLIREEPLLLRVGSHQLLTMRTPGDDQNLAIGFLLSEGAIGGLADVGEVTLRAGDPDSGEPDAVEVALARGADVGRLGRLTRTHEIRASCGVCGMRDAAQLLEDSPPLLPGVPKVSPEAIQAMRARFEQLQPLFQETGACHAAALFGPDQALWSHAEDVGRHNALDKAIGAAARAGRDLSHGIALLSGRAGFDLVIKCLRLAIPVVLSVSAPSALSFDLCHAAGATLVGFLRPNRMKVYCDGQRLAPGPR